MERKSDKGDTIILLVVAVGLLAFFFWKKSQVPPEVTYNATVDLQRG